MVLFVVVVVVVVAVLVPLVQLALLFSNKTALQILRLPAVGLSEVNGGERGMDYLGLWLLVSGRVWFLGGGFDFYFLPYLGKIPDLTDISYRGWNHQL